MINVIVRHISRLKVAIFFSLLFFFSFSCYSQENRNYVYSKKFLEADGSRSVASYQYYDGLGRESQLRTTGVGGRGKVLATMNAYDVKGRLEEKWLPALVGKEYAYTDEAELKSLCIASYDNDMSPFEHRQYDEYGREISVCPAGEAWHKTDRKVSTKYGVNEAGVVRRYIVTQNMELRQDGYHSAGTLSSIETTDEDGHRLVVFTDLFGQKILERRGESNDTYFVYNDLGQLRFVLSPLYQQREDVMLYGYEYRYDRKGRMIQKRLPGCQPVKYWYDDDNRLTFVQDGVLREKDRYRFMVYDVQNRLVLQGTCDACRWLDGYRLSPLYLNRSGGLLGTDYVVQNDDMLSNAVLECAVYYDDYIFLSGTMAHEFSAVSVSTDVSAAGLKTGIVVRASNGEFVYTALAYDLKGNIVEVGTKGLHNYTERSKTEYTFTDQPKKSSLRVDVGYGDYFTADYVNAYNVYNDKLHSSQCKVRHGAQIASSAMEYTYDDFGRIETISRPLGTGGQGKVTYAYNLHGQPTSIATGSFREKIYYTDGPGVFCYNGNVSSLLWKNGEEPQERGYKFSYDNLNRLTLGEYGEGEGLASRLNHYTEGQEYDSNGNIIRQKRYSGRWGECTLMDDLELSYEGNQLSLVREQAPDLSYMDNFEYMGEGDGNRYFYNVNGALQADTHRLISHIDYDDCGNPLRIQFSNGNVTKYVYTSVGQKLRTIHYTAMPNIHVGTGEIHDLTPGETLYTDSVDYLLGGSLLLRNGSVYMYRFDGGYFEVSNYDNAATDHADNFTAYYHNTDHLGNIREVVREDGALWQQTDYYPFGTPHDVSFRVTRPSMQPYRYNGKELDMMHGLNTYDYGARQYNSVIGAWDRTDPMAEKYYNVSPYVYCENNPINAIDINGDSITMDIFSIVAIYNGFSRETNLNMKFKDGVLDPNSIRSQAEKSNDTFLQDLYQIAINPQMVELKSTVVNSYIMNGKQHSELWHTPEDYNVMDEPEPRRSQLLSMGYQSGRTVRGNLGQTLYPRNTNELKRSGNNNIQVNINIFGSLNHRTIGIAHEFAHVLLYLRNLPHNHNGRAGDYIYGHQWNVMKRLGYDYVDR